MLKGTNSNKVLSIFNNRANTDVKIREINISTMRAQGSETVIHSSTSHLDAKAAYPLEDGIKIYNITHYLFNFISTKEDLFTYIMKRVAMIWFLNVLILHIISSVRKL